MKFIEDRPLSRYELNQLLIEAPEPEVRNLLMFMRSANEDAFDFFNKYSVYKFGLIVNQRPVYFAYITHLDDRYELWTVVNSDVKEQYSLYKYSKLSLKKALKEFSPIYATMETHNQKNLEWVTKMGFRRVNEEQDIITFMIERGK